MLKTSYEKAKDAEKNLKSLSALKETHPEIFFFFFKYSICLMCKEWDCKNIDMKTE